MDDNSLDESLHRRVEGALIYRIEILNEKELSLGSPLRDLNLHRREVANER